jgi:NADH dehydrogenase/NADH:ubiquinone oxidoreductase subunit G
MQITITIDGKSCECAKGEFLLDIAARNGIEIPTLCHHGGLPGQGCCRVCIVEVEEGGWHNVVTACIYPIERECAVLTDSERVKNQRGMVLSLLKARAPESAEIKLLCEELGVSERSRFTEQSDEKCILCALCVGACLGVGTGAISTVGRGVGKAVSTPYGEPSTVCVGCASCHMVCPTGAIEVKESDKARAIWNRSFNFKFCVKCGENMGTYAAVSLAAKKAGVEVSDLCADCKKKAITDVFAETYGV